MFEERIIEAIRNSFMEPTTDNTAIAFAENEHKTLVQNYLRFAFGLINYVGSGKMTRDPGEKGADILNACRAIVEKAKDALGQGVPFI